jgi:hypothetical protein
MLFPGRMPNATMAEPESALNLKKMGQTEKPGFFRKPGF